jgi:hypothetical protein
VTTSVIVNQTPSSGPCQTCSDKLGLQFYHPSDFCPLRAEAIAFYNEGTHFPRSHFRKYLEANNLWQPKAGGSGSNTNGGRRWNNNKHEA